MTKREWAVVVVTVALVGVLVLSVLPIPPHARLAADKLFMTYCHQHDLNSDLYESTRAGCRIGNFYVDYKHRSNSGGAGDPHVAYYRVILSWWKSDEVIAVLDNH